MHAVNPGHVFGPCRPDNDFRSVLQTHLFGGRAFEHLLPKDPDQLVYAMGHGEVSFHSDRQHCRLFSNTMAGGCFLFVR